MDKGKGNKMSIISGYCKQCGFPASARCPKCGMKLCGNCVSAHTCKAPELELVNTQGQSETVKAAIRKPYTPRVKK